ncbi:AI-2E family transporter [Streptomyces sp. NPDC056738]|uniref:AI-2E family transporter n=1 Tax=Streptomyces sp. NPDC056738 TaxID=3345933 RepID=UPI00369287CA
MNAGSRRPDRPPGEPGTGRGGRRARPVVGSRSSHGARTVTRTRTAAAYGRHGSGDHQGALVHHGLRVAAAYAWRLIVVGVVGYTVFALLGKLQLVAVALFLALVVTAVLRPLADLLARRLPRTVAVIISILGSILLVLGVMALVGGVVASESGDLGHEFAGGLGRIERWLEGSPFHLSHAVLSNLQGKVATFVSDHRAVVISSALSGAGRAVEFVTGLVLALFCSLFFIRSGDRYWRWFQELMPEGVRDTWDRGGRAAWRTFAGYTRGIIIVAATNAVLVGIALTLLGVPLALPLTLLEFFAAFIPLVGSPVALGVATVVALASKGPVVAIIVLALIVVIGQIEGHVLHPLVMSWAVRLHPVVVALSVIAGSILAGVTGAVVAVPMVSVAWSVITELRSRPEPEPPGRPPR